MAHTVGDKVNHKKMIMEVEEEEEVQKVTEVPVVINLRFRAEAELVFRKVSLAVLHYIYPMEEEEELPTGDNPRLHQMVQDREVAEQMAFKLGLLHRILLRRQLFTLVQEEVETVMMGEIQHMVMVMVQMV